MEYKGLSSFNKAELKLYDLIGVGMFRKAVFLLEKVRHYKDKGFNRNYHLEGYDIVSVEKHNGFLLYNAFLHCVSLFLCLIYFLLAPTARTRSIIVDIGMIALVILNVYCIALQRANYLKMKAFCCGYYRRYFGKADSRKEEVLHRICALDIRNIQEDYEVLGRLRDAYLGKKDCFLGASDKESLKRIYECGDLVLPKGARRKKRNVAERGFLEQCKAASGPYTVLQRRVHGLQSGFRVTGRRQLDCTSVVTEDGECEALYSKLVPRDTVGGICFLGCVLYDIYEEAVWKMKTDGV